MKKKKVFQKLATVLTVSMLMTSVTPFAGLAKTYYEVPIGSSDMPDYDLATMPNAELAVVIDESRIDLTSEELKGDNGYEINFGVSVDFDWSDIASPGDASASDWDSDIWGSQILSEMEIEAVVAPETEDAADKLGLELDVMDSPYALNISAANLDSLTPGETYTVQVGVQANTENVSSYPEDRIIVRDGEVVINITVPEESLEKPVVVDTDFFKGDEDESFSVAMNHALKLPFSFEDETILTVDFEPGQWSEYYDVEYDKAGKQLVITGKLVSFFEKSITSMYTPELSITVETDKHIYTGKTYVFVDFADNKPEYWKFKNLKLEKGKTVTIPLPVIQGKILDKYTIIRVEDNDFEEIQNPDEVLEVKFSEDYSSLILTAKQELTDTRVRAQIVTDDYTCYRLAAYKVSTGNTTEDDLYFTAPNPTWIVGYPGIAKWDISQISEEDKEKVVQTYARVYCNGEYLGRFNSKAIRSDLDLRSLFNEPGEYVFQMVFATDGLYRGDIPDQYWSEFSEPYEYNPPEKKISTPKNLKWNADGSMGWDKVEETYDYTQSNQRYFGHVYGRKPGDDVSNQFLAWTFTSSSNRMDPVVLESGYEYVFNVMAYGDLINYANSELSVYSEPLSTETVAQQSDKLINELMDGNVKDNIENTELSKDEKGNLKLGIQTDETVAKNYEELEKLYKTSKTEAGESVDFEIEADDSVKDSANIKVVGGILNGAAGIEFKKPTDETWNESHVSQFRRKFAVNISLTGDLTGELKYPVLITIPVPDGISPTMLIIIHEKHDKSIETIEPRINSDGTVSFAVTEFSTFFFVDSSSTGGSGSSGGGGGGSSFSGTSAAGTVTTDAKKGRVNSLTGIIIGSGDGYSKWISETPQGQPEAAIRWKLQYADGTFAAGSYVTDAQGNLVKDATGNSIEQPLWELISGAWYAFGADGYVKSGFLSDPALNGTFYMDVNTGMKTGWQQIDGKWYYFNQSSDGAKGIMYVSRTTPDGYAVNEAGVWDGTTSQTN